jgi:hypothetical protein
MSDTTADLGSWERHLCAPLTGRKVISAFELLAGMTGTVAKLRRWGTERPLLIADGIGTGTLPSADDAYIEVVEPTGVQSLTEQVRARTRPLSQLTTAATAAVERYDPDRSATWWLGPIPPNTALLGRPVLGGRPPAQIALEDKLLVDAMLDEVGAVRSPSAIAPARYDDLMRATERLLAAGVTVAGGATDHAVWAGDSRDGINGAGDYVRWIRSPGDAADAAEFFAAHCDRVRVTPFLEGVPCSIHGIVLPDGVVVLRPMELVTLRRQAESSFFFGGMGTSWDPSPDDTASMRGLARDLGHFLQRKHGYRGAFGVDGVLTADGFRVTELNPRFSGGLGRLATIAPEAQLELVHVNALIGRSVSRRAEEIEARALDLLEANRIADLVGMSAKPAATTTEVAVRLQDGRLQFADGGETGQSLGLVQWGPASVGSFVRLTLRDSAIAPGTRGAPLGVLLCEFADRTWNTGFGDLAPAPDVRMQLAGG